MQREIRTTDGKRFGKRGRALLGGLLLAAASTLGGLPATPVGAQTSEVTITWTLEPAELTVGTNSTVTWTNNDGARHRIQSTSGPGDFDSGNLDSGESFSYTFSSPGTYQYIDARNPDLSNYWGTIVVADDGGTGSPTADVFMAGRFFRPASITITAGESVTFLNDDGRDHTVTARDASYDSGIMPPGASYTRTYAEPGTYEYFCALHPDMVGTVLVQGVNGEPPPPPAPPAPPPPAGSGDVAVIDFDYNPVSLSVGVGSTVTWVNNGAALHTVTGRDGSYDSGLMSSGQIFSRTFSTAGTYEYFCTLHPNMVGTILVSDGSGAPPPPAPPPGPPPAPVAGDVSVIDFAYGPREIQVPVGTRVTWANNGVALHTVTARTGLFDSGLMQTGRTFAYTFNQPGTYQYFCTLHPDMTGVVTVPSADGDVPPPEAPPPAPPPGISGDVQAIDFAFAPANMTVPAGSTITWVNTGVALHTATARDGSFDSGFLNTGDSFSKRFDQPGTFEYFCTLHPDMIGTVTVTDAQGEAPPPVQPPAEENPVAAAADIDMLDFVFDPVTYTVPLGGSITWVNRGAALHTATAVDGSFDSGFLTTGQSFTETFDQAGTYDYLCTIHPGMVGTIIVDPNAAPPAESGGSAVAAVGGQGEGMEAGDIFFIVLFGLVGAGFAWSLFRAFFQPRIV